MKKRSFRSLSLLLPALFVASVILIMVIVIPLVFSRFQNRMIEDYTRMAYGVTQLVVNVIDGDKVDEYIEKNFDLPEYVEKVDYLYTLKANYPDVLYLYVCRFEEDGGHIIIDLDADEVENGESYEVGYVYEMDEPFASCLPDIMAGRETPGYAVHTDEDGFLYSYIRPIYRSDGSYACSACVDFSIDRVAQMDVAFTLRLTTILLLIAIGVLCVDIFVVRRRITRPINELSMCAGKFAYETDTDRKNNIELLEALNIHTGDEIETVYQMLRSVTRDSYLATTHLAQAKMDIQDMDERLTVVSEQAYKDNLTGVGNAAAFKLCKHRLTEEILSGTAEFAVVMLDINNLKYINDTFGHSHGDDYIRGCCKLVCDEYKRSPVYRIGGDEFVVVLQGDDYRNRDEHFRRINGAFERSYSQTFDKLYRRYSASLGMSAYIGLGDTVETAISRADQAMYEAKAAFRKKTGQHR